jgi:uncharacterized membrane protein
MLTALPTRLYAVFGIGLFARVVAGAASGGAYDYWKHRLPTASCLDGGGLLYCDCACNHTPLYPYASALMFRLSPDISWIRALLLTLPAAIGDALIAIALFLLLKRLGKERIAVPAAVIYALNPISIYEIRLAHWDGLTTLALLASLYALASGKLERSGVLIGLGALLKQFPLALLPIAALKQRDVRAIARMTALSALVVAIGFSPFLLACPTRVLESLSSHPLWNGNAPSGVGIGTIRQLFEQLGVPQPKLVWALAFSVLLGLPALKANEKTYFVFTSLVMVVLAYFTYATHRQLVVWALPFMIVASLERRAFFPLVLVAAGYAVRLVKPDWYFGLIHLVAGGWYYVALSGALAASSAAPRRSASPPRDAPART